MTIVRELVTLLRYKVDESGLKKDAHTVQSWWRRVVGLGRAASDGWREGVRGVLDEYGLVPGQVIRGIIQQRRLNREQRESAKNVKAVGGQYTALAGTIKSLFGAYLGFEGIRGFLTAGDEFGQIEARLKNATSSYGEFIAVDKELAANSRESYKPFAANAELFIRTNDVMKAMGKTTRDTLDVVSATNLSLAASGATADKAASFIDQFGKALGNGKLTGDAFQSMVANNQRMLKYLVDGLNETHPALGATMANFQKLVQEGKITTDVMLPALRSQMAKMRKDVEDMPVSMGDAVTVFRDKMARVSWELEKQHGVIRKLTTALGFLGDHLREILHLLWLVGMSWGLTRLAGSAVSMTRVFRTLVGLVGMLIKGLWVLVRPFLRWLIVVEAIRLIFNDVLTWLRGGESLLGTIIGRSEEWEVQIQAVRDALEWVKGLLGGGADSLGQWLSKWGAISIVVGGLILLLGWIPTLLIAGVLLLVRYWNELKAGAAELWQSMKDGAEQSWLEIQRSFTRLFDWFSEKIDWVKGLFAGMVPDMSWVPSGADISAGFDRMLGTVGLGGKPPAPATGGPYTDSRSTKIYIQTADNPAAVARAASEGVNRAYGPTVPVAPNWNTPNVEAAP